MRDDAAEIADRLTANIEGVLDALSPGWVSVRGKGYLTAKSPKQLGSFTVNLTGPKRGCWYRFSCRIGGGPMFLVAYLLTGSESPSKGDYRDAFQWARRHLGMSDEGESDEARQTRERAAEKRRAERARAERQEEAKRRRKAETAQEVRAQCVPIAGTLAEEYLTGRGIPIPPMGWPDVLGFHESLEWELGSVWDGDRKVKDGPYFPALVGWVQDVAGEGCAVWRIFLDPLTGGKAPVSNPKVGMGPAGGGAVRIGGVGPKIGVAEGLETALAAWTMEGYRFPIWAALSTSGMVALEPPLQVQRISIFPDGDLPSQENGVFRAPPGLAAATKLRDRMAPIGINAIINEPPFNGDYLDVLKALREQEHGKA